jgi:hypothetical protein
MNNRHPVTIPVQPWFKDHSFGGKIVFAAVETMILLAAHTLRKHPDVNITVMEDALFAKFLEITESAKSLHALLECEEHDGRIRSKLLSQTQVGKMRRIKEHGAICFARSSVSPPPMPTLKQLEPPLSADEITSELVYRKLVPFGPCYHTLQGKLLLSDQGAWGRLKAPQLPFTDPVQEIIGSPFPLDGAMHAACVLGQQRVDYPPFPVGFSKRIIAKPTQPGAEYIVRVVPVSHTADEELFDLGIFNEDGEVYEMVTGLRMRDVTKALR